MDYDIERKFIKHVNTKILRSIFQKVSKATEAVYRTQSNYNFSIPFEIT